ncbi:MAG: hypothetical protein A3K60_06390 [Euryarchaeota archaeon RBG_19FT_COMBO_56_21]|nr:MAG: hypothetical protein A3K60_06390 [Euryarchaeota archaeon RBG_19FT_COMBO_56_21]
MEVKDSIRARRSIRKYRSKSIPREALEELLEAARLAPSSSNLQAWNIVVVTDKATKNTLVPASGNQGFVGECSAYLVGVAEADYNAIDIAIALDHISLRAVELGLGTCWIGDFDPQMTKKILGIPDNLKVHICMTLGYPAQSPPARKRKQMDELFFRDKWSAKWK